MPHDASLGVDAPLGSTSSAQPLMRYARLWRRAASRRLRQRDRRNITPADIIRCIEAVDNRRRHGAEPGGRGNQHTGGKSSRELLPQRTRDETARIVGVSPAMVQRARAVLDYAAIDPEPLREVREGRATITMAANTVRIRVVAGPAARGARGSGRRARTSPACARNTRPSVSRPQARALARISARGRSAFCRDRPRGTP